MVGASDHEDVMRHLVGSVLAVSAALAPGANATPCGPAEIVTGCGTQTGSDFRGVIIVPGSAAANRAVARSGGCEGCEWTLVVDCDHYSGDPAYVHCNAAACPNGTTFRIYLQRPTDPNPVFLDNICLTATRRIVTAADLADDMDEYLKRLRPPAATISVQPEGRAVTGLATFFAAGGATSDTAELDVDTAAGPATLRIAIEAGRYTWDFGDGARCETAAPGGAYDGGEATERCDDRVAHVYAAPSEAAVMLRATWQGTYTFDVGYGPVGPLPIPGDGVAGPAATRMVTVRDARARLVGG